ncbi:hypothetical protein N7516_002804 [Penicillium verrucosum]|uniref:uncharacterized protein n=1 Tax=Penicillium verrucosum TaxID=60171 RepID=UPI0025458A18|nr:uncharacterized protein N7516_002804 [Penicillium verrucosum]KAJ5942636.1 hypothetical protein N7516_002804 [Penicillium verrucosum]
MSDHTTANSINGQEGQGDQRDRNEARQTESTSENTASLNSEHNNDSPGQSRQQELDLNYYRKFLEDLVGIMRDAHSDSVAQLVLLIRSGASNEEIRNTIRRVQDES